MSFVSKDPTDLLPILLLLQRRIQGVRRELQHGNNGRIYCPKCGAGLCGQSDAFLDLDRLGWSPYVFCCHLCGERVDRQIFQNWLQSEFRIKLEMGLRPRKENEMPKCRRCHQDKPDSDFGAWGSRQRRTCKDCEEKDKAPRGQSQGGSSEPLAGDFGRMFAAIKKEGEREGAKRVAEDIIDFLKKKYMEVQ